MNRLSRGSTAGAVVLIGVLAFAVFLVTRSEDKSSPYEPETNGQPSISRGSMTPAAGLDDVLTQGLLDAFEAVVPGARTLSWAPVVHYLLGGRLVRTLDVDEVRDPSAWTGCPKQTVVYAGRDCPISMLAMVEYAATTGDLVVEVGTPATVGCDTVITPARAARLVAASLRPDREHRDCFSDFAITLYVNADRQVEVVNFVASSP